jgi:hypothetical protein
MKRQIVFSVLLYAVLVGSASAEDPVSFVDAKLKAAVEEALGMDDPTPSDMLSLTSLDASSLDITHLTGLEYATNLQTLNLRRNKLTDLAPLAGLILLQDLDVSRTGITGIRDISPLANLVNLQKLLLDNNQISDLSPLAGLTLLKHLDLHDNQILYVSPLAGLIHMEYLVLRGNRIWDVSALAGLTDLQYLNIAYNLLGSVSPLAGMSHLQQLELYLNPLSNISDLTGMTSLSALRLGMTELDNTAYCSDLQTILNNNPKVFLEYNPNPRPPTGISASDGTYPDKVRISWEPVCNGPSYTSYYRVSRASSQDGPKTPISPWQTACSFDDTSALAGTPYYYGVQAASGSSGGSPTEYSDSDIGWLKE